MDNKNRKIGEEIRKIFLLTFLGSNIIIGLIGIIGVMLIGGKLAESSRVGQTMFIIVIAAIVACIIASILLAARQSKRVSQKISEPIHKLEGYADSIANGDFTVEIDMTAADEIGTLANAFKRMIESYRLMKTDVDMLISETLDGNLDKQADPSRHKGAYRKIIEGVNQIFETIQLPFNVASDFINKLAEGEHQDDIENTYKGHYAILMENLNKVRHSVNILEDETDKLAEAGIRGDLDVRGDASNLKGVFAKVIDGINKTFDAIEAPLDAASGYIEKMANGEEIGAFDNPYKGYYARLIDNLKKVNESLNVLLGESTRLAQAGERGDLGQRGDVTKVKGSYARIIDGFNRTVESLVAPLNEAETVLGKIAVNDYTVKMSDSYKGTLKEFAEAINNVREHLLGIEKILAEVSRGCGNSLDGLQESGKLSENDKMIPSIILMIQSIHNTVEEAERLASATIDGNLSVRGDEKKFEGDYLQVIKALNRTMDAVAAPIEETSLVLQEMAQNNLTIEVTGEYRGEYNKIKVAANQAITSFNELLGDINVAASQVAVGSKQVSDASQSLSQGAAEQASSVEELTSSITEVATQTRQNAADASQASELSSVVQAEATQGNEKMNQLLDSMQDINESSANISKIIKVIDDIAFQTNILALNAAVEAARAGQYGKGFAVVAEEVRNLAAKSAEAAKNTTALIEGSVSRVEAGTKIANETANMLNKISESIKKATALVGNIASASNEQATAITQIDQGISQVSTVVQTNSATAEESAASSEELSGQASVLSELVRKFKLNSPLGSDMHVANKSDSVDIVKAEPQISSPIKPSFSGNFGKY